MLKEENTGREHRDDGNMKDGHTHTHGLCTLTHDQIEIWSWDSCDENPKPFPGASGLLTSHTPQVLSTRSPSGWSLGALMGLRCSARSLSRPRMLSSPRLPEELAPSVPQGRHNAGLPKCLLICITHHPLFHSWRFILTCSYVVTYLDLECEPRVLPDAALHTAQCLTPGRCSRNTCELMNEAM